jgi:hypothetical protein
VHFKTCEFVQSESQLSINDYIPKSEGLIHEFKKILSNFKNCELKFAMFSGLFTVDIGMTGEELQMELIGTQCDSLLKQKFFEVGVQNF